MLVNRFVRTACVVLALVIFTALLSSRQYFENNRTFTGCVLLLIGLYDPRSRVSLVPYQLALVYFGAAFNKMLDADWRSGQFVQNWISNVLHYRFYANLSAAFPGMLLSSVLGRAAILWEYLLAFGFLQQRFFGAAIAGGIAYHTALLLVTGRTYGMFYFALLSAYLACVEWPRSRIAVEYPNAGALRRGVWRVLRALDVDGMFEWSPTPISATDSADDVRRSRRLAVVVDGTMRRGAAAYVRLLAYTPLTYFMLLGIVHSMRGVAAVYRALLRSFA